MIKILFKHERLTDQRARNYCKRHTTKIIVFSLNCFLKNKRKSKPVKKEASEKRPLIIEQDLKDHKKRLLLLKKRGRESEVTLWALLDDGFTITDRVPPHHGAALLTTGRHDWHRRRRRRCVWGSWPSLNSVVERKPQRITHTKDISDHIFSKCQGSKLIQKTSVRTLVKEVDFSESAFFLLEHYYLAKKAIAFQGSLVCH